MPLSAKVTVDQTRISSFGWHDAKASPSTSRQRAVMPPKKNIAAPAFVFINYSDPVKDRKTKSNKHLVTKHATIHACKSRRRKSSNESGLLTPSPQAESEQHHPRDEGTSHLSRATSQRASSVSEPYGKEDVIDEDADTEAEDMVQSQDLSVATQGQQEAHDPAALFTLMSCMTTDPFDTLPVKANHQIWKLLHGWLNAGNQVDAAEDGYRMQVAVIRKSWFWPMVNRNKATFNAAVAWIAASTGDQSMEAAMTTSLAASLPALRENLLNPQSETAESAWYSIILLLAIAMRTGDMDTVHAHYQGLASLLSRRPEFVTSTEHITVPFTASFLYTFVASVILANYDAYRQEPSLSYLPYYVLATGQPITDSMAKHHISTGFKPLFEHGVLSSFFYSLITHIIPLQPLARAARRNKLSATDAAALLNAVWCCQLGLYIPKPITTEIEENIWIGVMMYWHLERRSWKAVDDLALALSRRLQQLDLRRFIQPPCEGQRRKSRLSEENQHHTPDGLYTEVLLWLSICAGTFVEDREAKTRCSHLTTRLAREMLEYSDWSAVHHCLRRFFWTDISDDMARRYWSLCPMSSELRIASPSRTTSSVAMSFTPVQRTQQHPFGTISISKPISTIGHGQESQRHSRLNSLADDVWDSTTYFPRNSRVRLSSDSVAGTYSHDTMSNGQVHPSSPPASTTDTRSSSTSNFTCSTHQGQTPLLHQNPTQKPLSPLPPPLPSQTPFQTTPHTSNPTHQPALPTNTHPTENQDPSQDHLPCQFCRHPSSQCRCRTGRASPSHCPDHLRGSLWAVPPSIFAMFCRPVWVPHDSRELPAGVGARGQGLKGVGMVGQESTM